MGGGWIGKVLTPPFVGRPALTGPGTFRLVVVLDYYGGVDKMWGTSCQIVKSLNKASIRVEGVSFLTRCPAVCNVPNELSVVPRTI